MKDFLKFVGGLVIAYAFIFLVLGAVYHWANDDGGLPHRAMYEVDIQGHQAGTPGDMCPGQYTYRLEGGLPLYCWGRR